MFSIIMPLDSNRLEQFKVTKKLYDAMPQKKEFIIPTRSEPELRRFFEKHNLGKDVKIFPYVHNVGFNCSKALNIGVRNAKYPQVIITSPEVMPITPVLEQLMGLLGTNVICQVFDENKNGRRSWSLVNEKYRNKSPGYYFLALFNKADIEKINGWDEEFMKGYAYEDADFGERWIRSGQPFVVRNEIQGVHQYHQRGETIPGGNKLNLQLFMKNNEDGIIKCKKGLFKLKAPTAIQVNT